MTGFKTLLNEIGEPKRPDSAVAHTKGAFFTLGGIEYEVDIRHNYSKFSPTTDIGLIIDFRVRGDKSGDYKLTGAGNPLSVVGAVQWVVELWLAGYWKSEVPREQKQQFKGWNVRYILYNPQYEFENDGRRDRLYMVFLKNFARGHGSTVKPLNGRGAEFHPPVFIKG